MKDGSRRVQLPPYLSPCDAGARAACLRAAIKLFVRKGIEATSVRDIAAGSGFSNPAIFKHFDSKEALALCLFERCYVWMSKALRAAGDAVPGAAGDKIAATVACALQLIDEDQEAVLYVQENLRRFLASGEPGNKAVFAAWVPACLDERRRRAAAGTKRCEPRPLLVFSDNWHARLILES